jgi:protein subunit release factor A
MRELVFSVTLKDCEVHEFTTSGAGGQRRDKKKTGIRIVHPPSGAVGQSSDQRSQWQNKKTAFKRMAESKEFKLWVRLRSGESARVAAAVERELWPDRIKVEVKQDGEWVIQ